MGSQRSSGMSSAAAAMLAAPGPARLRVGAGAAVILLLLGLGVAVLVSALGSRGETGTLGQDVPPTEAPAAAIYVHVLGAVASPGLFELPEGSRAVDAVAAAGGFAPDADRGAINLARFVDDGEQIAVPVIGAVGDPVGAAGTAGDGRVNINMADAATLETLPRVGPAMAARIIAWRDANGRFSSVDDLLAVTGIGEKTLEGMRSLVTV
ncbi:MULTISPECIES: ComEA family DNA-binding protein [unclassified Salinibacterium]|uniref:ComEA family DNA-binding protein n=1 Tax=unclassified Salinibacterium TaxID=2632331 RepID=UPI001F0F3242|nr:MULTISPECIES: ComEA family DNA-binding protein [unclassified Salinibacterium]